MGFQDVSYLPSPASFYTTSPKYCGRGKGCGTVTCLTAVVAGMGMLPIEYLHPNNNNPLF